MDSKAGRDERRRSLNVSMKTEQKSKKRRGAESGYMWVTMAGPNSSMVDPTELVEIITVGVVKIVSWREDDGGGSRSRKVHVRGG